MVPTVESTVGTIYAQYVQIELLSGEQMLSKKR